MSRSMFKLASTESLSTVNLIGANSMESSAYKSVDASLNRDLDMFSVALTRISI